MKYVSFPESRFSFREVVRGIAILLLVLTWVFSRTSSAGSWEYAAPFSVSGSAGTGGVVTGGASASGRQLFRDSVVYTVTPYVPPAQPSSSSNSWLPFAMVGLAMAPMLFSDAPANHVVGSKKPVLAAADVPGSKTPRRAPAGNPPRRAGQQVQPQYQGSGAQ